MNVRILNNGTAGGLGLIMGLLACVHQRTKDVPQAPSDGRGTKADNPPAFIKTPEPFRIIFGGLEGHQLS
jgi:hypothetical protein